MTTPVLDNHLHLHQDRGKGLEAVEEFRELGGTHMLVVNLPSWQFDIQAEGGEDFRPVFERTIGLVQAANDILPGRAWPVLGVHPGLISRLTEWGHTPAAARDIMQEGLDIAAEYVANGQALALKSGRPHYEVSEDIWTAANAVMQHAFDLGAANDCAVQLHTEAGSDFTEVATWAQEAGMDPTRVVKHYAAGPIDGLTPSVISSKDELQQAVAADVPFLMETDFLDDPSRPGAVLGPKTVPRRVRWLQETGHDSALYRAHVETPKHVYGIDTEATLTD